MTTVGRRGGTTAHLLTQLEAMQQQVTQQHYALKQQQHVMEGQRIAMEEQRVAIERLHAAFQQQVPAPQLPAMSASSTPSIERRPRSYRAAAPFRRTAGVLRQRIPGRARKMGVGLSLALLLLVAPWGSAVTHAGYEATDNTAYGLASLPAGTGYQSSAFGADALHSNINGEYDTAVGGYALYSNTSGWMNTASGNSVLYSNTTGNGNTASGNHALTSNTTGNENTASGGNALYFNTTGNNNTATGTSSLSSNDTGDKNTASGSFALYQNTTGINNTALGYGAGRTDASANSNTTGSNNTFIGYNSGPGVPDQLVNATAIGASAVVSQSNSIVLGGTGPNTQKVGVGTETPHSAFQVAKGFLQIRPVTGSAPAAAQCATADDAGRLVVRTDGNINLYVCTGTTWIGK